MTDLRSHALLKRLLLVEAIANDERWFVIEILLIDDDPFIHALARLWLSGTDCVVESVSTIWDGLARTVDCSPDVVLLDIGMPDFSGLDLLKLVREHNLWADAKLIVITGSQDSADRVRSHSLGAHAFLQKRLREDSLTTTIQRARSNLG